MTDPQDLTLELEVEAKIIRANLACDYEDYEILDLAYITSVCSQPYSKNTSIRRPMDYTISKLSELLNWRITSGASTALSSLKLASTTKLALSSNLLGTSKALAAIINTNSMYIHGYTKDKHPILWLRCDRKGWYIGDVAAEIQVCSLATLMQNLMLTLILFRNSELLRNGRPSHRSNAPKLGRNLLRGDRRHVLRPPPPPSRAW